MNEYLDMACGLINFCLLRVPFGRAAMALA